MWACLIEYKLKEFGFDKKIVLLYVWPALGNYRVCGASTLS